MARTYLPTLRRLLHGVNVYIARNQANMTAGMTPTQVTALLSFIQCLIDLINALGAEPVND